MGEQLRSGVRPTIRDVARLAGVSHVTVSRYLTGTSYVSAETGSAIEAAVRETGYRPNRNARSLVNRRTRSVAFVVRERPGLFFADPTLSAMAVGANAALAAADHQMILLIVDDERSESRIVDLIAGGGADGAILVAMRDEDPVLHALAGAGVPAATAGAPAGPPTVPSVDTDNAGGTEAITRLLLATGVFPVGEIRGPADTPASASRHAGFLRALNIGSGDEDLVVTSAAWSMNAGADAMNELLTREPGIRGVVAASDLLAFGALDALHAVGLEAPRDVGIVGFDDSPWATRTRPPLSTVRQDAERTGRRLAELVLEIVGGAAPPPGHVEIIPAEVVWRESAGAYPRTPSGAAVRSDESQAAGGTALSAGIA